MRELMPFQLRMLLQAQEPHSNQDCTLNQMHHQ
eukprot:CCRYP_003549-RA/>CCRYP_003549-RA protein AED:0.35 eAED:0.35 QI:114/1/1/1/0/0/2/5/32